MNLDLADEEAAALTRHLRQAIEDAHYPMAPRLDPLKDIHDKARPAAASAGTAATAEARHGTKRWTRTTTRGAIRSRTAPSNRKALRSTLSRSNREPCFIETSPMTNLTSRKCRSPRPCSRASA